MTLDGFAPQRASAQYQDARNYVAAVRSSHEECSLQHVASGDITTSEPELWPESWQTPLILRNLERSVFDTRKWTAAMPFCSVPQGVRSACPCFAFHSLREGGKCSVFTREAQYTTLGAASPEENRDFKQLLWHPLSPSLLQSSFCEPVCCISFSFCRLIRHPGPSG
jgi:hypothetical protein